MTMINLDFLRYLFISIVMLMLGMIFYAFYNKLIIIRLPVRKAALFEQRSAFRKKIPLYHFDGRSFIKDEKELIISANTQATLKDIVASWLSYVDEEQEKPQKVTVQSVLLDATKTTAFISFDKSPFMHNQSTFSKLMYLEGLLKTLRGSTIPLKKVQFLVHHAPFSETDIDTSHPWTIAGYVP